MNLRFVSIREDHPGVKWRTLFERHWPGYRRWYLGAGLQGHPSEKECLKQLHHHMPELLPFYETLLQLGRGDELVSRFLSLYCPPAYISGCSQAVWTKQTPFLIRNYDYSPKLFDATVVYTNWLQPVIAMSDCLWGVLDGMNHSGLAISLAFGGNKTLGKGFGIPLILRYVLEVCQSTQEAVAILRSIPAHMAYNVTVVDHEGDYVTAFLAPQKETAIRHFPVATNYQRKIRWHVHARKTETLARQKFLETRLADSQQTEHDFIRYFLQPPLFSNHYAEGFGTLYTALYRPQSGEIEYRWPTYSWHQSFTHFREEELQIPLTMNP